MTQDIAPDTTSQEKEYKGSIKFRILVVVIFIWVCCTVAVLSRNMKGTFVSFVKPLTLSHGSSSLEEGVTPPPSVLVEAKQPEVNPHIVNWVYENSKYISRKTCTNIVKIVFNETKYPLLMLALIRRESNFNPIAISDKGAVGLCQIMWEAHEKELQTANIAQEKRDLFDIETNIKASNLIFTKYLKQSNQDLKMALKKYVGGAHSTYARDILEYLGEVYLVSKKPIPAIKEETSGSNNSKDVSGVRKVHN